MLSKKYIAFTYHVRSFYIINSYNEFHCERKIGIKDVHGGSAGCMTMIIYIKNKYSKKHKYCFLMQKYHLSTMILMLGLKA